MQRFYLFHIAYIRWFGAIFAGLAIFITASNVPSVLRAGDAKLIAITIGSGAGFLLIGCLLYRVGTAMQRRYRAHIAQQVD